MTVHVQPNGWRIWRTLQYQQSATWPAAPPGTGYPPGIPGPAVKAISTPLESELRLLQEQPTMALTSPYLS